MRFFHFLPGSGFSALFMSLVELLSAPPSGQHSEGTDEEEKDGLKGWLLPAMWLEIGSQGNLAYAGWGESGARVWA